MHGDHAGLIQTLAREESVVYCSDVDAGVIQAAKTSAYWEQVYSFLSAQGFPAEDLEKHSSMVTSYFAEQDNERLTHVNEGDVLAVGGYLLTCVSTPGHTPGHMCLYEPKHKFLIAGDHILANITSNITYWPFFHDSLGWYLRSLHKIDLMDIDLVLPGHRNIINDCHERIAELELHHQNRLEEALGILRQGPMNGYQVASQMHWDMPHDDWAQVPSFQKWFATGEAIAHLEHLAEQGLVQAIRQDNRMTYKLM
jgi:glyoxylase-like metal-dependent hydrolase (beta-lactamase superfamily II)